MNPIAKPTRPIIAIDARSLPSNLALLYSLTQGLRLSENHRARLDKQLLNTPTPDLTALFRWIAKTTYYRVEKAVLSAMIATGLSRKSLSILFIKNAVQTTNAECAYLLQENHPALRLADNVLPPDAALAGTALLKAEKDNIKIVSLATATAQELNLPALTSVLYARRKTAQQRINAAYRPR